MRVSRLPVLAALWVLAATLLAAAAPGGEVTLAETDIIRQSNPDNTRVAVRLDDQVNLRVVNMLDRPQNCFCVDLYNVKPDFAAQRIFPVQDDSLRLIQTMWFQDTNVLRIIFLPHRKTNFRVLDLDSLYVYEPVAGDRKSILSQPKAKYLLIDVTKDLETPLPPAADLSRKALSQKPAATPSGPLTKRLVIIDPGHGGKSMGAVSRTKINGKILREKDVVLAIAKEVSRLLNKTPVATAVMTREGDDYLSLADRVSFAERLEGDLFVSIHANAARYHRKNNSPRGVEFYYLSPDSNPEVRDLEMAENEELAEVLDPAASKQLQLITRHMAKDIQNELRSESSEVAGAMDSVFRKDSYYTRFNRGVKSAAFKVLRNQAMPAMLVEVGFIDHDREAQNLANPTFQKRIAMLITNGILEYIAALDSRIQPYQYQMAY